MMIGSTISHYKILEKLGEGGMGVVYKAEDTKLKRTVALKFLPPHLAASDQDKTRFIQEAQSASALNHPNVCTIHDIEEHDGPTSAGRQMFIVMEYVEGQTLRERKQSVSLKQSIEIGIQIADGLAAAHEKGIVHRDIKPENIMIRKDGIVQIMDFGLAKLRGVSRLTKEGSTLGTAGYMSPEQVQGLDADHRSDIFSLGVVLYELMTGQLPFKGVHETAVAYEIVNVDAVPMSSVKPEIDPSLDAIILECLAKEPDERCQSAKEVSKDLKRFKQESSRQKISRITKAHQIQTPSGVRPPAELAASEETEAVEESKPNYLPWLLAVLFFVGIVVIGILYLKSAPELQSIHASILPPEGSNFHFYGEGAGPAVISPDGRRLAFVATSSDKKRLLWVRSLDEPTAQSLSGTEDAKYPFWSPDNQYVGYFAGGNLMKVDAAGGPPTPICDALNGRGGAWNRDGTILLSRVASDPISRVSSNGGTPIEITKLDTARREQTHRWPYFLPDGKHFLYLARTAVVGTQGEADVIYVSSIDSKLNKILLRSSANVAYASGHVLFMRGSTLMAHEFDTGDLELKGEAISIAEGVLNDAGFNLAVFSVSQNGVLVYQLGSAQAGSNLTILDRSGKQLGIVGDITEFYTPRVSPDGKKIAVGTFDATSRNQDIWIYDIERGIKTRFTFDLAVEFDVVWSPDGNQIVFDSNRKGQNDVYRKSSSGASNEELLYESDKDKIPEGWSRDGNFISLTVNGGSTTRGDIWVLPLMADREPFVFLQTQFNESHGQFSPDGRWLAYTSDESGRNEIYARPFPGPGGKWQISIAGGTLPRWGHDGRELFYLGEDDKLMAAEIKAAGSAINVTGVQPLFETQPIRTGSVYDVFSDGKRFLVNTQIEPEVSSPITLVVNWMKDMRKK
jgi:serine/threonine protein kinase